MSDITQADSIDVELARTRKKLAIEIASAANDAVFDIGSRIDDRVEFLEQRIAQLDEERRLLRRELVDLTNGNDYWSFSESVNNAWEEFFHVTDTDDFQWLDDRDRLEMFWELYYAPGFTPERQKSVERLLGIPVDLVRSVKERKISSNGALERLGFRHDYANLYGVTGILDVCFGVFPAYASELPRKCFTVYFLLDESAEIVYIGQSRNVRLRLKQHWREKRDRGIQSWVVMQLDSYDNMNETESRLIRTHRPKLNVAGNPDRDPRFGGQP